ncbi:Os04g0674450 [Oryza sativa Japonica Group]|uniref:Os04g0674450 protein n=1 Tax=Oryza sativa subsp. japonica TaxID=39947 RepID=C7J200_ORYSJ|nr:Os04g0674450 [Oryza sativa Japonica Group]|eukprot:NP_001174140.1 Os04g0674450 [Oryza sativa Japonica Group]
MEEQQQQQPLLEGFRAVLVLLRRIGSMIGSIIAPDLQPSALGLA